MYNYPGQLNGKMPFDAPALEAYKQQLDAMAHTPGQVLAAQAIYEWSRVSHEYSEVELSLDSSAWLATAATTAAFAAEKHGSALELLGDLSELTLDQRLCAEAMLAVFQANPEALLKSSDLADVRFGDATLGTVPDEHFRKIMKTLTARADLERGGVVRTGSPKRPFYWLQKDPTDEPPTKTRFALSLEKMRMHQHGNEAVYQEEARMMWSILRKHSGQWFGTRDLGSYFFDAEVSWATRDRHVTEALARIAEDPEYGGRVREDMAGPGQTKRIWYAEDTSDRQLPPLRFTDTNAPRIESRPIRPPAGSLERLMPEQLACAQQIVARIRAHPDVLFRFRDFGDLPYKQQTLAAHQWHFRKIMKALTFGPLPDDTGFIRRSDEGGAMYWHSFDLDSIPPSRFFKNPDVVQPRLTNAERSWLRNRLARYITDAMRAEPGRWFSRPELRARWVLEHEGMPWNYPRGSMEQAIRVTLRHPEHGPPLQVSRDEQGEVRMCYAGDSSDPTQPLAWTEKLRRAGMPMGYSLKTR